MDDEKRPNIFAEAIKTTRREPITKHVEPKLPFFHHAIEQEKLKARARNMTRQEQFNNGFLTVDDMDDEELRCGRMRDSDGRIPKVKKTMESIPRDLYDEMVAEHQRRTQEKFRQQLDTALETMIAIMTDETVEPRDRADAAKYLIERTIGKTPERVQVAVAKAPWEEIAMEVGRLTRAEHEQRQVGNYVDAEVVEDVPDDNQPDLAGQRLDEPSATADEPVPVDPAFAPAPAAPSHDKPASSNPVVQVANAAKPTNSQVLAWRACDAEQLRAMRKAAKKRIQDAKKRRIIQRTLGRDAMPPTEIHMDVPEADEGRVTFRVE